MAEWLNAIGVTLILFAFVMLSLKKMPAESPAYKWLNFIGGSMLCTGAYMIAAWAFVVMEGVWSAVALYSIVRK